jgi:hypothetical protein
MLWFVHALSRQSAVERAHNRMGYHRTPGYCYRAVVAGQLDEPSLTLATSAFSPATCSKRQPPTAWTLTPNHGGKTDGGPIYNARNGNADVDLERISRPPWFEQKGFAQECFSLTVLRRAKAIMNRVALVKFICRIDDLT